MPCLEKWLWILCLAALVWVAIEDWRKMEVPLLALIALAVLGAVKVLSCGGIGNVMAALSIASLFLPLYFKRGMGEGDILLIFALALWFEPVRYLLVVAAGFALGVAHGIYRMLRSGTLKGWLSGLRSGVVGVLPESSSEALARPDCIPLAGTLALIAGFAGILQVLSGRG